MVAIQRLMFLTIACASATSRKRGLGLGGTSSCNDAKLLKLHDSWSYNWKAAPQAQCGKSLSHEFVPMAIGTKCASIGKSNCAVEIEKSVEILDNDETRAKWKAANAKFLLGYNEPDAGNGKHNHPHEASPADAAKAWPKVQALAKKNVTTTGSGFSFGGLRTGVRRSRFLGCERPLNMDG